MCSARSVELGPDEPLSVAFVARHYWPAPGAATIRLQALAKAFSARGCRTTVITRSGESESSTRGPADEQLFYVAGDRATGLGFLRIVGLARFAFNAWRLLRRIRPDVVICDPPPTSGLASIGAKDAYRAYYLADSWSGMLGEAGGWAGQVMSVVVRPIERLVLCRADLVIAVRSNLQDEARAAGAKEVLLAPYGTNLETFQKDGPMWSDPWSRQIPYFVYAGNYGVIQGASVFLEAAELAWDAGLAFGLVFMGYGAEEASVRRFAARHTEYFRSLPMQSPETAASAYRGSIAALASMRPVDVASQTRPAKALAALATGCPVIFAGTGCFADEIHEHGLGVAAGWDARKVAQAMQDVLIGAAKATPEETDRKRRKTADFAATNLDMSKAAADLVELISNRSNRHQREGQFDSDHR